MKFKSYFFFLLFLNWPLIVYSNDRGLALSYKPLFIESAWEAFNNNAYNKACEYQNMAIDANKELDSNPEEILKLLSDLTLFLSNVIELDTIISYSNVVSERFNNDSLNNTKSGYLHSARCGYFSCLAEDFITSDSLTLIGFKNVRKNIFTPEEQLEIYAYRAAYYLSKLQSIRSLDFDDYKSYEKFRDNYLKEAQNLIENGMKIGKTNNKKNSIFYRYLLSLKERIEIGKIKAYINRPYSDIETNFKLSNNTEGFASYTLLEYYNAILGNLKRGGEIMESLKFLEPLAQISVKYRGENQMCSELYSLISDLYLKLLNFSKAEDYARKASFIDNSLGSGAFKDSSYHAEKLLSIQSKSQEYKNIKYTYPLYAFEQALMNQGSIRAKLANYLLTNGYENYYNAIGNYLSDGYEIFDFDKLIQELAGIYGQGLYLKDTDFQTLTNYRVNPYIELHVSRVEELILYEFSFYQQLRIYSPTIAEAKNIILNKINTYIKLEEKSLFYYYLAKCYFYEGNLKKAINAQREHLKIELQLSGNQYTNKILEAQKTLSLLCMTGMWEALSNKNKKQIKKSQNLFIEIGKKYSAAIQKYVETNFPILTTTDQKTLWNPLSNWFYNTIPYMGMSGEAAGCIFDSAIFSKGLLLSAAQGEIPNYHWQEIQQVLDNDDIAIEFINFRNIKGYEIYYAVTLTNKSKHPIIYPIFSDFEFEHLKIDNNQIYKNYVMYDLIMRPIEISENIKNIYFSPSGILNTIAIENLIDSLGIRSSEKWNMYRLSSTRELVQNHKNIIESLDSNKTLIYGDLDYDCSLTSMKPVNNTHLKTYERLRGVNRARVNPLQFSRPEIESIANTAIVHNYTPVVLTGDEGSEESFKYLSNEPFNTIHFSTHGFYYSDKRIEEEHLKDNDKYFFLFKDMPIDSEDLAMTRSALVMSGGNNIMRGIDIPIDREDGLLTAMEISKLSLKNCDLVSLSACETALGKVSGEGVFGLQRGFKIAGVQSILMSLWEVDDEATQILMTEFYRNYLGGMSKQQALREAQKTVSETPGFSDPEYWAAFILLDALN